jgi:hypothetical protein
MTFSKKSTLKSLRISKTLPIKSALFTHSPKTLPSKSAKKTSPISSKPNNAPLTPQKIHNKNNVPPKPKSLLSSCLQPNPSAHRVTVIPTNKHQRKRASAIWSGWLSLWGRVSSQWSWGS